MSGAECTLCSRVFAEDNDLKVHTFTDSHLEKVAPDSIFPVKYRHLARDDPFYLLQKLALAQFTRQYTEVCKPRMSKCRNLEPLLQCFELQIIVRESHVFEERAYNLLNMIGEDLRRVAQENELFTTDHDLQERAECVLLYWEGENKITKACEQVFRLHQFRKETECLQSLSSGMRLKMDASRNFLLQRQIVCDKTHGRRLVEKAMICAELRCNFNKQIQAFEVYSKTSPLSSRHVTGNPGEEQTCTCPRNRIHKTLCGHILAIYFKTKTLVDEIPHQYWCAASNDATEIDSGDDFSTDWHSDSGDSGTESHVRDSSKSRHKHRSHHKSKSKRKSDSHKPQRTKRSKSRRESKSPRKELHHVRMDEPEIINLRPPILGDEMNVELIPSLDTPTAQMELQESYVNNTIHHPNDQQSLNLAPFNNLSQTIPPEWAATQPQTVPQFSPVIHLAPTQPHRFPQDFPPHNQPHPQPHDQPEMFPQNQPPQFPYNHQFQQNQVSVQYHPLEQNVPLVVQPQHVQHVETRIIPQLVQRQQMEQMPDHSMPEICPDEQVDVVKRERSEMEDVAYTSVKEKPNSFETPPQIDGSVVDEQRQDGAPGPPTLPGFLLDMMDENDHPQPEDIKGFGRGDNNSNNSPKRRKRDKDRSRSHRTNDTSRPNRADLLRRCEQQAREIREMQQRIADLENRSKLENKYAGIYLFSKLCDYSPDASREYYQASSGFWDVQLLKKHYKHEKYEERSKGQEMGHMIKPSSSLQEELECNPQVSPKIDVKVKKELENTGQNSQEPLQQLPVHQPRRVDENEESHHLEHTVSLLTPGENPCLTEDEKMNSNIGAEASGNTRPKETRLIDSTGSPKCVHQPDVKPKLEKDKNLDDDFDPDEYSPPSSPLVHHVTTPITPTATTAPTTTSEIAPLASIPRNAPTSSGTNIPTVATTPTTISTD